MNFTSKSVDGFNAPNTITTLTGNVIVTQGTMKVTGDVAKLYLDGDQQVARVVVTVSGNHLAHIEQLDENDNLMTGDARQLDYDNINGIAVLTTDAVVTQQGRGDFHGNKLTYNQNTSLVTGDAGDDGLVHGMILPKNKNPAAPANGAKPAATPAKPAAAEPAKASTAAAAAQPTGVK